MPPAGTVTVTDTSAIAPTVVTPWAVLLAVLLSAVVVVTTALLVTDAPVPTT